MSLAEKVDYSLIPVIDVADILFGQERGERTSGEERHFPDRGGLFVNTKKNRWYCHSESKGGDAIALIEFATGCDFKGALDWLRSQGFEKYLGERSASKKPRTLVTTYHYQDASGAVAYHVDRFDDKSFGLWREINGERVNGVRAAVYERTRAGGQWWVANDQPRPLAEVHSFPATAPVPYHLPELIARASEPVLIPAGEKDVDNLLSLGLLATTNHGGEGKWWPELTPYFKDRRVFLLLDNDTPGERHCAVVGAALKDIVKELRVVRFPELPEKGDVSNFIEIRRKDGLDDKAIGRELRLRFRDALVWEHTAAISAAAATNTAADDGWPAADMSILSHTLLSPPRFPLEVFGTYWAKWTVEQAEAKSCPPDYIAAGLIAGAGALIGNARWGSPWPGWEEPPILWFNVIGNPSSGKSPGLDAIRDLLSAIEADSNIGHQDNLASWDTQKREAKIRLGLWEEACKAAMKDGVGVTPPKPGGTDEPPRPTRKRIVTNDPTIEKVARLVLENPKGLMLFRDELSGWIGSLDKYGGAGGDRAFYLEAYGGRSYAVDRMKDAEPIVVPSLSVIILGGMQPDRMVTLIFSGDDDGLAARFIYVWPERVPPQRPKNPLPIGAKTKMTRLHELEEQRDVDDRRSPLRFDEAAARALQAYRTQVAASEADAAGLYLSWLGKLPGMAVRLAIIFEHLRWCGDREDEKPPEALSEMAVTAAVAFLDGYAAPMARRCFGEAALPQVDIDARVLAQWILANLTEGMTINSRSLRRDCVLSTKEAARYDAAIAELEAAGWLRSHPCRAGGGGGRRRKDFEVNPQLLGGSGK